MQTTRIIVVDRHELVALGIAKRLANCPELDVVGHSCTGLQLLERLRETQADLILIDVSLHEMDGIDTVRKLHRNYPGLNVLAHSALTEIEYVNSMLIEGASGYVLKDGPADELAHAVRTVMNGGTYISPQAQHSIANGYRFTEKRMGGEYVGLTKREREIIRMVALDRTNREIADALFITEETVKTHRKNLMTKLNVRGVAGLVKYAVDRCWV